MIYIHTQVTMNTVYTTASYVYVKVLLQMMHRKYSMRGRTEWHEVKASAVFDTRSHYKYCIFLYIMSKRHFNQFIILCREDWQ